MSATSRHETAPYVHCALTVLLQQSTLVTVSGILVSQHTDTHRPCPPCTCVMAFYHLSSVLRRDRDASHARHDLSSLLVLLPIRGTSVVYLVLTPFERVLAAWAVTFHTSASSQFFTCKDGMAHVSALTPPHVLVAHPNITEADNQRLSLIPCS
jgi:hypothetical protein